MAELDRFQRLYIIAPSLAGPCKIGIALEPHIRCADLQTGNHRPLRVYNVTGCPKSAILEQQVHGRLADRRILREWFDVSVTEAQEAIGQVCYGVEEADFWRPIELGVRLDAWLERQGSGTPSVRVTRPAGHGRKLYLKLKARERRKREREEADKMGLTVKAYRATKRKQNDGGKDQQLQTGQDDG